jgi:hypothetical protein
VKRFEAVRNGSPGETLLEPGSFHSPIVNRLLFNAILGWIKFGLPNPPELRAIETADRAVYHQLRALILDSGGTLFDHCFT